MCAADDGGRVMDEFKRIADSAAFDQTAEAWRNHARILATYYAEMRASGFGKAEAFGLVMQSQEMTLHRILWPHGGPD